MAALSCLLCGDARRANEQGAVQPCVEIRPMWIEYGASALQNAMEGNQAQMCGRLHWHFEGLQLITCWDGAVAQLKCHLGARLRLRLGAQMRFRRRVGS